jgi:hypothetical protein
MYIEYPATFKLKNAKKSVASYTLFLRMQESRCMSITKHKITMDLSPDACLRRHDGESPYKLFAY